MNTPVDIASAEAAEAAERGAPTRRMAPAYRQFFGFLFALALVVGLLAGWAWAQDQEQSNPDARLRGELAFLVLVIWWGITVMSSLLARLTRRLHKSLEIPAISTGQALVWAVITVVAVPMAIQLRWLGLAVPLVSTACATGIWFARRRSKRVPHQPLCFSVVVGALALVPLVPLADWLQANHPTDLGLADPTLPVQGDAAALASELQPLLFFDNEEKYQPVKIETAEAHACKLGVSDGCDPVSLSGLANAKDPALMGKDYIKVTAAALDAGEKPGGPASAIYYHVWKPENGPKAKLYVDYWWYFPHNPAPVAGGVLCGKALTRGWLGAACAEHPADWEGITLVLEPKCDTGPEAIGCVGLRRTNKPDKRYKLSEVHYAQHDKVVWYRWEDLHKRWGDLKKQEGNRPLVFVALHSHASYAMPCVVRCQQLVLPTVEERRNGVNAWTNNLVCSQSCLLPLPTYTKRCDVRDGEVRRLPRRICDAPSKWNAFDGHWGAQNCILLESYCDSQRAPKAPAFQRRYQQPCRADVGGKIVARPHCPSGLYLEGIAENVARARRILGLGF